MSLNVLSLFAGIGGLELGLERAGMTVVGQVEINEYCRRVLAKHWPEVPKHDDVRTAVNWWLGCNCQNRHSSVPRVHQNAGCRAARRPAVHVVAGGFPCQPHSVAGDQQGPDDDRWGWPAMRGVIKALEPTWVLIENVPNLISTGLADVLADLAALGFDACWTRVPAAAVGAPHLRWRLFVVAAHTRRVQLRLEPWRSGWAHWAGPTVVGVDGSAWALADTHSIGRIGRPGVERPGWWGQPADGGQWAAEPDVGRVAHGVPARVDRLRALGNAVVPQVAEYVGRLIVEHSHLAALEAS